MQNSSISPSLHLSLPHSEVKPPAALTVLAILGILPLVLIFGVIGYLAYSAISGGPLITVDAHGATHYSIEKLLIVQLIAEAPLVPYVLLVVPKLLGRSLRELGFRALTRRDVLIAIIGAFAMIVIVEGVASLVQSVLHDTHEQQAVQIMRSIKDRSTLEFFALYAVLLGPVIEELVFRFFVFNCSGRLAGFWAGAIFSACLFGLAHGDLVLAFPLALGGVILACVYGLTRNAYASMITHALFNGSTVVALLLAQHLPASTVH